MNSSLISMLLIVHNAGLSSVSIPNVVLDPQKKHYSAHEIIRITVRNRTKAVFDFQISITRYEEGAFSQGMNDIFAEAEGDSLHMFRVPAHSWISLAWDPNGQRKLFKPARRMKYRFELTSLEALQGGGPVYHSSTFTISAPTQGRLAPMRSKRRPRRSH